MTQLLVALMTFLLSSYLLIDDVTGHGMLMDPPGRSTMWRYNFDGVAPNYDDNGLNCGGFSVQFNGVNQGRCGECGDDWSLPRPRPNDEGGKYGTGIIGQKYFKGQVIAVEVQLTSNHMGHFEFRLCPKSSMEELVTQECLDAHPLKFMDGSTRYQVDAGAGPYFKTLVQLPMDVECDYCVIQWTYVAGNNWGVCDDGSGAVGCGNQETFRNCADVAIVDNQQPAYGNAVRKPMLP